MKVVMLPGSMSRLAGGLFTSVRRLSGSLQQTDSTSVEVVAHADVFSSEDVREWEPLTPRLLKRAGYLGRVRELVLELDELKPDIVHRHFLWSYATVGTNLNSYRKPTYRTVVSPRGMLDSWALRHRRWKKTIAGKLFENRSLRSADCLHALNENEAAAMQAYGLKNAICVIPNGIDLPEGRSSPIEIDAAVGRRKRLLFLGRIHPKKGLASFLQGWALAQSALRDWEFVIAGWDEGGHEKSLRQMVSELGIERHVVFAGPKYGIAKAELLESCDAFTLPSFSEGLPMSVLEAWANRLPVLMTDHCNLPVGFECGAAIRIAPDAESSADGLRQLAEMAEDDRRAIGARGYQLARSKFTWDVIAQDMLQVYLWIQGRGPKPKCVIQG